MAMKRSEIRDRIETARLELLISGTATPRQRACARCKEFNDLLVRAQEYLYDGWHGDIASIGDEIDYAELVRIYTNPSNTYDALDARFDDDGRSLYHQFQSAIECNGIDWYID